MESEEKSVTWDDCQNEDCLKFIAECRFGGLRRKQMEEEARRQKALKRELEANEEYQRHLEELRADRAREQKKMVARRRNGRKVVDRCKQIGFELTEEQKEAFLAGALVKDVFSDEERKQYMSLCHRK